MGLGGGVVLVKIDVAVAVVVLQGQLRRPEPKSSWSLKESRPKAATAGPAL